MPEIVVVPANSSVEYGFPARYLFVKDISIAGAIFTLKANGDSFSINEEMEKSSKISGLPETLTSWEFVNDTAVELTIIIKAGLVYYEEDKIVGDINSLTTPANKSIEGNQFIAGASQSPVVGQYSQIALNNPLSSGVEVVVSKMELYFDTNAMIAFYDNVSFAALGLTNLSTILSDNYNKLSSGLTGQATMHYGSNVGYDNTKQKGFLTHGGFASISVLDSSKPMHIEEGYALVITGSVTNKPANATLEWSE